MKKQILNLGKVLSKVEQKNTYGGLRNVIGGGSSICRCRDFNGECCNTPGCETIPRPPKGFYTEDYNVCYSAY